MSGRIDENRAATGCSASSKRTCGKGSGNLSLVLVAFRCCPFPTSPHSALGFLEMRTSSTRWRHRPAHHAFVFRKLSMVALEAWRSDGRSRQCALRCAESSCIRSGGGSLRELRGCSPARLLARANQWLAAAIGRNGRRFFANTTTGRRRSASNLDMFAGSPRSATHAMEPTPGWLAPEGRAAGGLSDVVEKLPPGPASAPTRSLPSASGSRDHVHQVLATLGYGDRSAMRSWASSVSYGRPVTSPKFLSKRRTAGSRR